MAFQFEVRDDTFARFGRDRYILDREEYGEVIAELRRRFPGRRRLFRMADVVAVVRELRGQRQQPHSPPRAPDTPPREDPPTLKRRRVVYEESYMMMD